MQAFLATAVLAVVGALVLAGSAFFAVASLREKETRAFAISSALAVGGMVLFVAGWVSAANVRQALAAAIAVALALLIVATAAPHGRVAAGPRIPDTRFDERDIMYARAELRAGSPAYESYYSSHPEKKADDDTMRRLPGLLSPESRMAAPLPFAAADAAFGVTMALVPELEGEPAAEQQSLPPAQATAFLKGLAHYWGARDVGITEMRDYHLYSHRGMDQDRFGEPITSEYRFAIALVAELDHEMLMAAPEAPIIMESGRSYLQAGTAAVQLATFIRALGHPARAHVVDHYSMIAPLVARDAGLGEIGRNGVLISRKLGPRVRLSFVTTDLPLVADEWRTDTSVLDFCTRCRKCADNCPAKAIPTGDRKMVDGALRWRIDPERCYHYWCSLGTDCARCVAVCPYAHPDSGVHRLVRAANARSGAARQVALWLDDVFYGRRRRPQPAPTWIPSRDRRRAPGRDDDTKGKQVEARTIRDDDTAAGDSGEAAVASLASSALERKES